MKKSSYHDFLQSKEHPDTQYGMNPEYMPDYAFPFQAFLADWSIRKGRAAILADCGLGKSVVDFIWGTNFLRKTNKAVLIAAPLAVSAQFIREGKKFGIEVKQTRDGTVYKKTINTTNYENIHKYSPSDFCAVIYSESSILKNFDGKMRRLLTDFASQVPYRLLETATPAPNDYMELGTSSEALGAMQRGQMLGMFFTNGGETTQQWELKGHARKRFWKWVCTWARACRKPSDLGFDDGDFILPPLTTLQHVVKSTRKRFGFGLVGAVTLNEQRQERRDTLQQRCEKVTELIHKDDYNIVFCHLNPEGDLLEKLIPGAVNVQGSDKDEYKEEMLTAFAMGQIKTLVTKPKIGGWGLNLQHCNHVITFISHSFEGYYQSIRRCWRFGQKRPVTIDIVTSKGEGRVLANMQGKEKAADQMFRGLVEEMKSYQTCKAKKIEDKLIEMQLPIWLK